MAPGEEAVQRERIAATLGALGNPTRLDILQRLSQPRHAAGLARDLGISRQAVRKHLAALEQAGLVRAQPSRRRNLPVLEYHADPAALFAARESVQSLAPASSAIRVATVTEERAASTTRAHGAGLLVLHGDGMGAFLPLPAGTSWVVGRAEDASVRLPTDPFVSARHALLRCASDGWTILDLGSTNGTHVDFRRLEAGETATLRSGAVITVGRSHLTLRGVE